MPFLPKISRLWVLFLSKLVTLRCRNAFFTRMTTEKTEGVVLGAVRCPGDRYIVRIFTANKGVVAFAVRMGRGRRTVAQRALLQPLSLVELDFEFRERSQIQQLQDWRLSVTYASIPYDPQKSAIAFLLGEFLMHALANEQANVSLFLFVKQSLMWLDLCGGAFANFHLCFMIRISRFLGVMPAAEDYPWGAYFDLQSGMFVMLRPPHNAFLHPEEARFVPSLLRMNFVQMHRYRLNRLQRMRILQVLNDYYRLHIPNFPVLKSAEVLHALFS